MELNFYLVSYSAYYEDGNKKFKEAKLQISQEDIPEIFFHTLPVYNQVHKVCRTKRYGDLIYTNNIAVAHIKTNSFEEFSEFLAKQSETTDLNTLEEMYLTNLEAPDPYIEEDDPYGYYDDAEPYFNDIEFDVAYNLPDNNPKSLKRAVKNLLALSDEQLEQVLDVRTWNMYNKYYN